MAQAQAATQSSPKSPKPPESPPAPSRGRLAREQLELLTATSFCTKLHQRGTGQRPASFSRVLDDRRRDHGLLVDEGDRNCAECARKLTPLSAALVLVILPKLPTEKVVQAAKELRQAKPIVWAAIQRSHVAQLEQAMRRSNPTVHGQPAPQLFTAFEYQAMANELLAEAAAAARESE